MIVGFVEYCCIDGYVLCMSDGVGLVMWCCDFGVVFWWYSCFGISWMEYKLDGCVDIGVEFLCGLFGVFDLECLIFLLFVWEMIVGIDVVIDEFGYGFECEIFGKIGNGKFCDCDVVVWMMVG